MCMQKRWYKSKQVNFLCIWCVMIADSLCIIIICNKYNIHTHVHIYTYICSLHTQTCWRKRMHIIYIHIQTYTHSAVFWWAERIAPIWKRQCQIRQKRNLTSQYNTFEELNNSTRTGKSRSSRMYAHSVVCLLECVCVWMVKFDKTPYITWQFY
jgi:hypothetical protein